jgi:hypothetical protein
VLKKMLARFEHPEGPTAELDSGGM